jgi:ribosomal-protein-alanine N-acetyltransferase
MRQSWPQASPSAAPAPAADPLPAGVIIEPARLRDLPALAELQRRAFPPRLAYTTGTLALLWALPWVRLLVARRGKGIAGCIIGDRVIDGGRVINLAVDPDARRQGIGTALLAEIERALPVDTMTLMVQIENDGAQTLYRAVGYAEEATLPNYYGPGRAGVRMRKRLGEGDRGIGGRGG